MKEYLSFDDVLITPKFSWVKSRKDVSLSISNRLGFYNLPIISSNMDSVTGVDMAIGMAREGGIGCLHRFQSIEDNVKQFIDSWYGPSDSIIKPWISIGVGNKELDRAIALRDAGAETIVLDIAHGASIEAVNQTKELSKLFGTHCNLIIGNFATARSIKDFEYYLGSKNIITAVKVGIGGGSACLTRVVTGCGIPTFGSLLDCKEAGYPMIADGGMRNSGDIAKAIGAGASLVMLGGMLAGADESPSKLTYKDDKYYKNYRGSASIDSYKIQGKESSFRSPEGDSFLIPQSGPLSGVLEQINGGLRSALSYVGASTIKEFQENVEFIKVTPAGAKENGSHGRK